MEQMQIKATLEQAGVDYDKGLERFMGNVALYHKFLLKFLVDGSYADFVKELAAGDLVLAEKSVHTLKGTSGNLSLMRLFEAADATVQAIRTGQGSEEIKELAEKVGESYEETCQAIRLSIGE
jgi:HPt (histidine-containing phosphotransfer) domain-containing protein